MPRTRAGLEAALAAVAIIVLAGCVTDVSITGVARCDGLLQPSEETVDSPFDSDGDGFFDAVNPDCQDVYRAEDLDCDDGDEAIHPGAAEIECNGIDDDCDAETEDGYDADGDGVLVCDDCDDQDDNNFPGNLEVCDGLDNDCDGEIEVDGVDVDGDGWRVCAGDCDDSRAEAYEGAAELCNGLDEDCNGLADFDAAAEVDGDQDGLLSCEDCDDADADNFPGNAEICDGADNDCDGQVPATEIDNDGDLYVECVWIGSSSSVFGGNDCDDGPGGANNFPGNTEDCSDGLDNDCDGVADNGCSGPSASYSGTWIASPTVNYSCVLGLVTLNVAGLSIVDAYPSILISGLVGSQPGGMSGSFSSATDFSATNFIGSGGAGCDETYTITGSFTSASSFTAVLTADFFAHGPGECGDAASFFTPECTNQSWSITGVR